jgi:hypothetical protein
MKKYYIRILLALLYGGALVFSLTRCSPNAASLNKAALKALQEQQNHRGGANVDANSTLNQAELKAHFVRAKDMRKNDDDDSDRPGTVVIRISTRDDSPINLKEFKETGEVEFSLEQSTSLFPNEAWLVVSSKELTSRAAAEGCSLKVTSLGDNEWKVSLPESAECKSRSEILAQADEIRISFRGKDPGKQKD